MKKIIILGILIVTLISLAYAEDISSFINQYEIDYSKPVEIIIKEVTITNNDMDCFKEYADTQGGIILSYDSANNYAKNECSIKPSKDLKDKSNQVIYTETVKEITYPYYKLKEVSVAPIEEPIEEVSP